VELGFRILRWKMGSWYLSPWKRKGRRIEMGVRLYSAEQSFSMISANNSSDRIRRVKLANAEVLKQDRCQANGSRL
jgi:hypothetical protein